LPAPTRIPFFALSTATSNPGEKTGTETVIEDWH
jgi:hypothetical protein